MIKLLIFNIRMRLIEWLTKPEYKYVDHIVTKAGKL